MPTYYDLMDATGGSRPKAGILRSVLCFRRSAHGVVLSLFGLGGLTSNNEKRLASASYFYVIRFCLYLDVKVFLFRYGPCSRYLTDKFELTMRPNSCKICATLYWDALDIFGYSLKECGGRVAPQQRLSGLKQWTY